MLTSQELLEYIESHRRVMGTLPNLRECVEHFGGKKLNVMMALALMEPGERESLRRESRKESQAKWDAKVKRQA